MNSYCMIGHRTRLRVLQLALVGLLALSAFARAGGATGIEATNAAETIFRTGISGTVNNLSVSSDGRRLLFTTKKLKNGLQMMNLDTGKVEAVPMEKDRIWEMPSWSADGKKIVAISTAVRDDAYRMDDMKVVLIDPPNWDYRTVLGGDGVKIFPFFSRDGKSIYYFKGKKRESGATPASRYDLYRISLLTGEEIRLTHEEFYQVSKGDEDGEQVLFAAIPRMALRNAAGSGSSESSMYLIDVQGGRAKTSPRLEVMRGGEFMHIRNALRDSSGRTYFIGGRLTDKGGGYKWFVIRSSSMGNLIVASDIPIGTKFDLARLSDGLFRSGNTGEEIVFHHMKLRRDDGGDHFGRSIP